MRPLAYVLSLTVAALAQPASADEIIGQPEGEAIVYRVDGFDRVAQGIAGAVDVRVGPAWSVRAYGPAAALAELEVEREGQSLRLRPRNGWRDGRLLRQVRVAVTMPRLVSASVGGSGRMTVEGARGPQLRAAVGGSGSLALGTVAVDELAVSIGGSGGITAAGTAGRLKVSSSGSGGFAAPGLRAASAAVSAAGSGSVRAAVAGPAAVSLAGSGSVNLGPAAQCTTRRVGSGRVTCGA